jgi:ATP/ADP translocase
MVNPFAIAWLWRGFNGRSVTFALLFASLVLGASIAGGFTRLLAALGVHWLYVLIIPGFFFSWLSKREPVWLPDEAQRTLYARGLIAASIILAIVINQLRH